jgi:hypothetical protein
MPTKPRKSAQIEGRTLLAINTLQKNPKLSVRAAAKAYELSEATLRRRLKGPTNKPEKNAEKRKLIPNEEEALVQWALEKDSRGFPPHLIDISDMAARLLAARISGSSPPQLGKNWASRFIKRRPELDMRWSRRRSYARAKCEDPKIISEWFQILETVRQRYGICDEDIWNFDETGFAMGVTVTSKVVTNSANIGRAIMKEPGNREWVTVTECINTRGIKIPPFIIFKAKQQQAAWFVDLPPGWAIARSKKGWTCDELGLRWIRHFNDHSENTTIGAYRLLVLDGHSSHLTPEFEEYCSSHNIITVCMPAHASHHLQPLDVACFSSLKHAYGTQISTWCRYGIDHIDKLDFLDAYKIINPLVFTETNIMSGFRASGIHPANPDRVLSSLTITKTPSPPGTSDGSLPTPWSIKTPADITQLEQHSAYLRGLLRHSSQSPSNAVNQLVKACELAMSSAAILAAENHELRKLNARQKAKQMKPKGFLGDQIVLQAQQGQFLLEQRDVSATNPQIGGDSIPSALRQRAPPTCSICHIQYHTARTCTLRLQ